ncbi:serine hydrolase [Candidatus Protochlamydia phocaeensis]|uniref:serine hydrolase n=1 Tax=Candidatus Protochlamydia phocaeensis TaxID=1414722 RepID=UPI0008391EAD|nr:serine hydrolase [Candidatus Protochlamydia phocaeensis]
MIKKLFFCLALLPFSSLLGQLASEKNSTMALIEQSIQRVMKQQNIPGIAVALLYEGHPSLLSFGWADPERRIPVTPSTLFEIGSITKVFTTTALAIEVLKGRMHLNDAVTKYFPAIKHPQAIDRVTLVELATHTSSLPRTLPALNRGRKPDQTFLIHFLENWTPAYPIGTRYAYSNLGFGVLGKAIAHAEGKTYEQTIQQWVTFPLDMTETVIFVPSDLRTHVARGYNKEGQPIPPSYKPMLNAGSGAIRSTSQDMLKFLEANLGLRGPIFLQKAMRFAQQGFFQVNPHLTLGLGWQRFQSPPWLIIDKNGGMAGFSSYIGFIPDKKIGIVLLANKSKTHLTTIGRQLLRRLARDLNGIPLSDD